MYHEVIFDKTESLCIWLFVFLAFLDVNIVKGDEVACVHMTGWRGVFRELGSNVGLCYGAWDPKMLKR